ncbi:MAG: hypothetical protein EOP50_21805, partial [Sphingobacteriales bacterium]
MKKLYWSLFFLAALLCDCVFIIMNDNDLRVFSKPVLVLLLIGMTVNSTPHLRTWIKSLLIAALFSSW